MFLAARAYWIERLKAAGGNISEASRQAGVNRTQGHMICKRLAIRTGVADQPTPRSVVNQALHRWLARRRCSFPLRPPQPSA